MGYKVVTELAISSYYWPKSVFKKINGL